MEIEEGDIITLAAPGGRVYNHFEAGAWQNGTFYYRGQRWPNQECRVYIGCGRKLRVNILWKWFGQVPPGYTLPQWNAEVRQFTGRDFVARDPDQAMEIQVQLGALGLGIDTVQPAGAYEGCGGGKRRKRRPKTRRKSKRRKRKTKRRKIKSK